MDLVRKATIYSG